MHGIEIALVLLAVTTAVITIAPWFKLPVELLLLLGSLCMSLIPGLPRIVLDPEIVFLVFMPPILFGAAYFTSWRDFKANKRPISLLAVGLVLFTMVCVAAVMRHFVPEMPWPVVFLLGAMVAPPDASAATAIIKKLGVPRRLVTVLEGESLVNDATALVAYKFAVAAIVTGVFSLPWAMGKFLLVAGGGVAVGGIVGAVGIWLYPKIRETAGQTLLSFLVAFSAYTLAESVSVSGVISTVAAGLIFGRWIPATATAELRIEAKAVWDLILFLINAFVFTLIGFQLPLVFSNLSQERSWPELFGLAAAVNAAVVLSRLAWVFSAAYLPRLLFPSIRKKDPAPSVKLLAALGWIGMRGIVTLAAALALPLVLPNGAPFPHRDLLIFLAYTVILTTLLLPSLTLPFLLPWLGIHADEEHLREETHARIEAVKSVLGAAETLQKQPGIHKPHLDALVERYQRRLQTLESNLSDAAYSPLFDEDAKMRRLLREVIRHERQTLVLERDSGHIHNDVFHQLFRELDLEEMRLRTPRL